MADCGKTNTAAEEHSQIERGVSNPRVIDLIAPFQSESSQPESSKAESLKAESGVELVMIEDRPWGSDPAQLDQLQEKLNNYLDYVLDGFLAQQYPAYAGRKIRIALECVNEPKDIERALIDAIERYLASTGIAFQLRPGRTTV